MFKASAIVSSENDSAEKAHREYIHIHARLAEGKLVE
jgi:hypothetical protein